MRSRRVQTAALTVLVAAGVAAATSARGTGTRPDTEEVLVARTGHIAATPTLRPGFGGWCIVVEGEFGCQGDPATPPVLAEAWGSGHIGGGESGPTFTNGVAITTAAVKAVRLGDTPPLPTSPQPGLPPDLRAVAIEGHGTSGTPLWETVGSPRLTALGAQGKVLTTSAGSVARLRFTTHTKQLGVSHPPSAPRCTMRLRGTTGVTVQRIEAVTPEPPRRADAFGDPLFACASYTVAVGSSPMIASLLVDAVHPGRAPAKLPDSFPMLHASDAVRFNGPEGEVVARRVSGAWLAVQGGTRGQRLKLVRAFNASARPRKRRAVTGS